MDKDNIKEVVSEIKDATEDELTEFIQKWFTKTRTDGMKLGAQMVAIGVFGALKKHLNKPHPSLRDYERCVKDINDIVYVQLTKEDKESQEEEV